MEETLSLKIDYRESELIQMMQQIYHWTTEEEEQKTLKIVPLLLGDIEIEHTRGCLIIERKTWNDLWNSVKDGRYREQRSRLSEWKEQKNHYVMYLIEGINEDPLSKSCLRILHRLTFFHQFMIYRTQSLQETCQYVEWLYTNFTSVIDYSPNHTQVRQHLYAESVISKKKDIQDSQSLLAMIFYGIHGISKEMAYQFAEKYGSILSFITLLKENLSEMKKELSEKNFGTKRFGMKKTELLLEKIGFKLS